MLRITGYSDKYSVCPGDNIKFYINSEENEVYETQIVRLIHGDTNPEVLDTKKRKSMQNVIKIILEEIKGYMGVRT